MRAPFLLDLSHTSHTRARTGVQRVGRMLRKALGVAAVSVTFDPYAGTWRMLAPWELDNLDAPTPGGSRGAKWPLAARLRGYGRSLIQDPAPLPAANAGIVVPEIFSPEVAAALPALFARSKGPRIALFHDAIALRLPEFTPVKTVARFPAYLRELLLFDGIAAVSDDSRDALLDYWRWLGETRLPQVRTIPLGIEPPTRRDEPERSGHGRPTILCVGSIEGRKNHVALLDACEQLWTQGGHFELHLVGMPRSETGGAALERIATLRAAGRPLRHDDAADDDALAAAYQACTFTVYPSVMEGFGLPVLESLSHGKPCICSGRGALGESARDGGCLTLDDVGADSLAHAIQRLLEPTPRRDGQSELDRLSDEARRRTFRTWTNYAADLTAWMEEEKAEKGKAEG